MFNKDFYPTPKTVFMQLMSGKHFLDGKILEPSAGKGDMVKHIKNMMGRRDNYDIDVIEIDPELSNFLIGEGLNVVWDDFLTYETYKEYDYIIMNPPFSSGADHALKAIELAEKQISRCEIYMILNKETINNPYSNKRKELLEKLNKHDVEVRYVRDGFKQAQRKTDVEVALIKVIIPESVRNDMTFEWMIDNEYVKENTEDIQTALSTHVNQNKIQERLSDIDRLVKEYNTACQLAKTAYEANRKKQAFFNYVEKVNENERVGLNTITHYEKEVEPEHINHELDRLRRAYWALILDTQDFRDLLTSKAREKLNRQLNLANNMEINITNIKMLLTALSHNRKNMLIDSVVSMFKKITHYHMNEYSTNIHYYNGWKTNDAYKVNHKIIIPIGRGGFDGWDFNKDYQRINYNVRDWIDDLVKALQLIEPSVNNKFESISNQEFENEWLRFKMFLKGTVHIWFKDKELLKRFNYLCGQHFNWIPSEDEQKENEQARKFVEKEFGDIGKIKLEVMP